jgi:negative regulator of sigma E activity
VALKNILKALAAPPGNNQAAKTGRLSKMTEWQMMGVCAAVAAVSLALILLLNSFA